MTGGPFFCPILGYTHAIIVSLYKRAIRKQTPPDEGGLR